MLVLSLMTLCIWRSIILVRLNTSFIWVVFKLWIMCVGDGVKIMPDVRIGPNSIVGDGAVVTKDAFGAIRVGVSAKNRFFGRII